MSTQKQQIVFHVITNWNEFLQASKEDDFTSLLPVEHTPPKLIDTSIPRKKDLPQAEDGDILFTVKQFADYFQVSQNSARDWIKKGLIPVIRINKRIRIRKSEILQLERKRNIR